jgi:Ca2+-binding RTX toxin-like protein
MTFFELLKLNFFTLLLLIFTASFSTLSIQHPNVFASINTHSTISVPGSTIVTGDGISITDRGISLPGISIGRDNDRGIFGNLRDIVGNISSIIGGLGDRTCIIDTIKGGSSDIEKENYLIIGTNCDDQIKSGDKDDIIYAKGGDDVVYSMKGSDIVFGGPGNDRLYGGDDDDLLIGGIGNVLIDGGKGNDILLSGAGETMLVGGDGNDKLFAGSSNTIMYGGKGANTFDCPTPVAGLARSVVMDYNPSNGDTLAGPCKVLNTIGNSNSGNIMNQILPDTGDSGGSSTTFVPR